MNIWSTVKGLIGDVAPVLGSVLIPGPAGYAAGAMIAKALGVENKPESIAAALQGDPQALLKIKELEIQQSSTLAMLQLQNNLAQAQTNIAEAQVAQGKGSFVAMWIAGWRPAVGWSCALAFIYALILAPFSTWIAQLLGSHVAMPVLPISLLSTVLMGMLGLAGARTYEKVHGVDAKNQ